jgi:ubiquinone/menaquinone biosynthesis C-methylase UbiE
VGSTRSALKAMNTKTSQQTFVFDYEDESIIEGRGTGNLTDHDLSTTRLERCVKAFAGLPAGAKVLEVGCGAGRQARTLKALRPELELHGADLSQRAITEAQSYNDGVEYRVADATRLPYDDTTFDAVMLFDVLEHVPDVAQVVGEIARVLKPGGLFHGFIPIEGQANTLFYRLRHSRRLPIAEWKRDRIGHIQQLTSEGVAAIFRAAGLTTTEQSYSFHLLGQIFDLTDYWHRDRLARPNYPAWRKKIVKLVARFIFFPTWRLSYREDKLLAQSQKATGMHLTCRKI